VVARLRSASVRSDSAPATELREVEAVMFPVSVGRPCRSVVVVGINHGRGTGVTLTRVAVLADEAVRVTSRRAANTFNSLACTASACVAASNRSVALA